MKSLTPIIILALSLCALPARAATIAIPNGDFSSPDASGGYTSSISDFTQTGPGGSGTQVPTVGSTPSNEFSEATPGGEAQIAYSNPNGGSGTSQSFISDLSVANADPSLTYDLSIYVGNRADYESTTGIYTVDFYVNGTDVDSEPLTVTDMTVPAGEYAQLSLNYTPTLAEASDPIKVGFSFTQGASSNQGIFADFTLTTSPAVVAPEPTTLALIGAGLLVLVLAQRAKSRAS